MYSESEDFNLQDNLIALMDKRLASSKVQIDFKNWACLDVGGGGGLTSAMLSGKCKSIYCVDIINQNLRYDGKFISLLKEKFERNGRTICLETYQFHYGDAHNLMYKDDYFDFILSINAFEHIPDIKLALSEIARILKPGGIFYTTFDPIWTADSGSHFINYVAEPWEHLLCSTDEFMKKMCMNGASMSEAEDFRDGIARHKLNDYFSLFNEFAPSKGLKVIFSDSWSGCVKPEYLKHRNFALALERYSEEELTCRGMAFVIVKD